MIGPAAVLLLLSAAAPTQAPTSLDLSESYARRTFADNDRIRAAAEYQRAAAEAQRILDTGDGSDEDRKHFLRATAQLRAAQKAQ